MAIRKFFNLMFQDSEITIYGDGTHTRSFCYVDDLIEGIIRMMNGTDDFIGPVNLGNTSEISIIQLAQKIISMTGSKSKLVFMPLPENDPIKRRPDIKLAEIQLKWKPKISIEEGLERTIEYFKSVS